MTEFNDAEGFYISGRGQVFAVLLDRETHDFAHLIGQEVSVNGKKYTCTGIERFCHTAPWRKGERIGLLVKELRHEG